MISPALNEQFYREYMTFFEQAERRDLGGRIEGTQLPAVHLEGRLPEQSDDIDVGHVASLFGRQE
jgi:hypothetical protein